MATGTVMTQTIKVEGVNIKPKYGKGAVLVGEEWMNLSDKCEFAITDFEKGGTYNAELYVTDKGKKYINAILDGDKPVVSDETEKAAVKAEKKTYFKKKAGEEKVDWAAKDRSQLVGGRSHDAAELVHAAVVSGKSIKEVLADYKEALEGILSIADEVK